MQLVDYFLILLLLSAAGLCVSLIIYLNRITKSVKEIEADIKDLSLQVKPLIASTTNLSERLNAISEQAKQPVAAVNDIVDDVKERVDDILIFEDKIRRGLEEPVLNFVSNFSAVLNGLNAFWNTYRKRK
jgi:uncharacterized protein YoxC